MSTGANSLPLFKPQWSYPTPPGFRDEFFAVPFHWTIDGAGLLVRSLPWTLDDDVPYLLRGITFSQIGTHVPNFVASQSPGFCRIWEPHGNPLSSRGSINTDGPEYFDLALALGVWAQSGFSQDGVGINAFGFPMEPEIECPPGSTLLFDFQLHTNASPGSVDVLGGFDFMEVVSGLIGNAGAVITFEAIDPGAPNVALSIAVVGGIHVQVTLATDGGSALISTFNDVIALINAAGAAGLIPLPAPNQAFPLVYAYLGGAGTGIEIVPAFPETALTNGANPSTPMYITGSLLGVKRFQECL
jgi:hypothetical protein